MKNFLLVNLFTCIFCFAGYPQIKDVNDSLANAYQIAKVMGKMKNNDLFKDANTYKKILGSLIWYSNLPDGNYWTDTSQERYYTALSKIKTKWNKVILKNEVIFSGTLSMQKLKDKINTLVTSSKQKTLLQERIVQYYEWIDELPEKEKLLQATLKDLELKVVELAQLKINGIDTLPIQSDDKKKEIDFQKDTSGFNKTIKNINANLLQKKQDIKKIKSEIITLFSSNEKLFEKLLVDLNNLMEESFSASVIIANSLEDFTSSNITINNQKAVDEQAKQSLSFQLPSQAQMIDALAIYLAKRVKQETVLWFFESITKNAAKFELLQTFYPNTIGLLQSKEVYETPNMGTQWQYALSKDFVTLPQNLFNSKWLADRIPDDKKQYLDYLKATPKIASLITQRYNYQDLVRNMYLEFNEEKNNTMITVKDVFTLLYAINTEMYTYKNTKVKNGDSLGIRMLRYEDLRSMTKDELEIMLSLIDMKYDSIFSRMLHLNSKEFTLTPTQFEYITKWLGRIQLGIEQLDKIRGEFILQQQLFEAGGKKDMAFSNYNIWLFLSELFKLVLPEKSEAWLSNRTINTTGAIKYISQTQEIYNLISTKNFAGAVNTTIDLLDSLFYGGGTHLYKKNIGEVQKLIDDKYNQFSYLKNSIIKIKERAGNTNKTEIIAYNGVEMRGDTIMFKKNSLFAATLFEQNRHALVIIRKLAGFLNDAAFATSSKQIARVVESYAMPPGSYKRKRNSWWSVDLNAFVGPYVGLETIRKDRTQFKNFQSNQPIYGFSAPIGISISKTVGKKIADTAFLESDEIKNPDKIKLTKNSLYRRTKSTFTVTVSIVDLGAVVSYRFNNTTDTVLPQQAKWSQLISPGIHLSYGLPNTPLVFQTGFQLTSQLRKVGEAIQQRQYGTTRFYAGVMFDIPLLNIWSRDRIVYTDRK